MPETISLNALRTTVAAAGAPGGGAPTDGLLQCRLPAWEGPALADRLAAAGARCQFMAAADTRTTAGGDYTLAYVFAPPQLVPSVTVLVAVPAATSRFASLA